MIAPIRGINNSVAGIDAVFGGVGQLLDIDAASSRQSKGCDLAIPIRQTVACLRTEIIIRKFHVIVAFPCGAHEGTGRGYGRDAAIIGGIEHEVIKLIAAELKETVQGIAGFASQLIDDE